MMRFLFWVFIAMFWYGVLVGPLGPGMLALAFAVFVHWADKRFKAQDEAHAKHPCSAAKPRCTLQCLRDSEQECARDKF